jgi:antirestriction protein
MGFLQDMLNKAEEFGFLDGNDLTTVLKGAEAQAKRITELESKLEKYKKALNSVVSLDYHASDVEDASDHLRDAAGICRAALNDAPTKENCNG